MVLSVPSRSESFGSGFASGSADEAALKASKGLKEGLGADCYPKGSRAFGGNHNGVHRLRRMAEEGSLLFPAYNVTTGDQEQVRQPLRLP